MRKRVLFIGGLLSILLVGAGFALLEKTPLPERMVEALQAFYKNYPQEKVYLQFDKDYYAAGRTIWFKGYVTLNKKPTTLSTILYVELLNDEGRVLQSNKLQIVDGGASGAFSLDDDLPEDNYRIRAYTQWMRNFDPSFFFDKDIHVFNIGQRESGEVNSEARRKSDFSIQFFPESGDWVDGLESQIAFKAINEEGFPTEVEGEVLDDQGQFVDSIKSIHDGMGSFEMTPHFGITYQAKIKDEFGEEKLLELPEVKQYGVTLKLTKVNDKKVFFVAQRKEESEETNNKIGIAAQIDGQFVYYANINFSEGQVGGLIPLTDEMEGIMQVTLMSEEGVPLAERLVFIKGPNTADSFTLNLDKTSLQPRGKNELSMQLPDSVSGSFSVAVTDQGQEMMDDNQDNIISHFLLTADIKGNVYNPAWYFSKQDSTTEKGLDLVMLTNGWRRFTWEELLQKQYPSIKFAPEPDNIYIVGQLKHRKNTISTGEVSMFLRDMVDTTIYFMTANTDSLGYFRASNFTFSDTAMLYYKAQDTAHKGRTITIDFPPSPEPYTLLNHRILAQQWTDTSRLERYLDIVDQRNDQDRYISNRGILLQEVQVTAKRKNKEESFEDKYTSGMFKSDNGYSFDLTGQPVPYTNVLQYLQSRVPGLMVSSDFANPSVTWRGGTPGFYIDEMPADLDQVANIPVDDIALIKVYRPPFLGGFGGGNGGIAIYTKRGGEGGFSPGAGFTPQAIPGFTLVKEFYSPDYEADKKVNQLHDQRSTLYWNPNIEVDSLTHELKIKFFNSDISEAYRVRLEGLTNNGRLIHINQVVDHEE